MVEKTSLVVRDVLLLPVWVCLFGFATTAWSQTKNLDKSLPTVVMIEGKHSGTTSFGAGIVIGAKAGRIYIATANHVVRSGRTAATDIKVQFKFLPGEKYPAKLLEHPTTKFDLTVISVSTTGGEIPVDEFMFKVMGDSSQLKRRSDVHPLGNPGAKAWGVALNPEKVDGIKGSQITFQSSYIQKGHSGGALLDSCGDIVGLIVRDSPPNGEALRIESVVQELQSWGYPIKLEKTGGCAAAATTQEPLVQQRVPAVANAVAETGGINIRYTGDGGFCSLNIAIRLENNDLTITPTGNFFSVDDLILGDDYYEITGTIDCPQNGSCVASGEEDIDLRNGYIYDIVWENAGWGQCNIGLFDLSQ